MPEEQTVVQTETTQTQQAAAAEQPQDLSNKFQQMFFGEPNTNGQQPPKEEVKKEEPKIEEDFETKDPNDWFKEEFKDYGFEDIEKAKQTLSDWKKKAETKPEEIKFANDQSKQLFALLKEGKTKEVRDFLDKQETLTQYTSAEINDNNAEQIIKTALKLKNEAAGVNLSNDEINYKYNKQYGLPKEPVQASDELDEDFNTRKQAWQEQVNDIKMSRMIDAKLALPDLQKLKAELVLPELPKNENVQQPLSQEDLAKMAAYKDSFLKSANATIKDFNGFSVTVKDKDVELPINYGLSGEEKGFIEGEVKRFAESNYDVNVLFADRWLNEDGSLNTNKMTEDLSRLYYGEKASQKFANDAANKRLEAYLKEKKNIKLDDSKPSGTFEPDNRTVSQKMAEKFFG